LCYKLHSEHLLLLVDKQEEFCSHCRQAGSEHLSENKHIISNIHTKPYLSENEYKSTVKRVQEKDHKTISR
jgi:hypothetical protein